VFYTRRVSFEAAIRDAATRANTLATVRAMETEPQAWTKHWTMVTELGLCTVAQDGGTLADQASAVTAAAQHLIPGPILPTALGSVLDLPEVGAIALGPGDLTLTGDLATGTSGPVLGAGGHTLVRIGDTWCTVEHPVTPLTPIDLSRPLGTLRLNGTPVTRHDLDNVENLTATLFAAEAAGVAQWCLDTAVAYAKIREQFDRPIGSFQAVQHLCADMLQALELGRAGAYYALWACDADDPAERHRAAVMAKAFSGDALAHVGASAIQVFGGVGFTWEHDIHLFYKRLLTLQEAYGDATDFLEELAGLVL
jgi:hypothetical protein